MVKPGAPLVSWIFTAIASGVLILMFVVSFIRYRHKRQVKRSREQEYINRFNMVLPGYTYKEKKKSLARKIMTNTHAISMTDLCLSPVGLHSSNPRLPEALFEPSHSFEKEKTDVSIHTSIPPRPFPHLPDHLISQNSNDTTSDDEKPLVRPKSSSVSRKIATDIPDKALMEQNVKSNTKEQVLNNKRQQKIKPERKKHHQVSDVNMDNNFTKTSLDFADMDKQNYIVYSTNEHRERRQSFPVVDTVPTPDDIVVSSSVPSISLNSHYNEHGGKYAKVKSKHGKGHRDGPKSDRHGKKHKKHGVQGHRPRSLPQLDDVYYANVYDDPTATQAGPHNPGYIALSKQAGHSAAIEIDRVFIKRNPLVSQRAQTQSDPTIPLSSFPFISQSEDLSDNYPGFNSEYM